MAFRTMELPFGAPKMDRKTKCPFRNGDVVMFGDVGPCVVLKIVGPVGPPSNLPCWSFQFEVLRPFRTRVFLDGMVPTANPDLMMPTASYQPYALRRISLVEYRERFLPLISCDYMPLDGKRKRKGDHDV